jgi:hypothetical protein
MYLVSFKEYKEYLKEENIDSKCAVNHAPCIVQFLRSDIMKAKIEVVDLAVFKWNEKFGDKFFKESANKYWIRGKEWEVDKSLQ